MRRTILSLLAVLIILAFSSCGNKEADMPDLSSMGKVALVSREEGSGTKSEFYTLLGISQGAAGKTALSTNEVIEAVSADKNAIGYVAYSALSGFPSESIKVLKIEGILCDPVTIKNGRYALERKYILAYSGALDEREEDFLSYVKTAGQAVVADVCVPLRDPARFLSNGKGGAIRISGSSSMETLLEALIEGYAGYNPDVEVTFEVTDSTDGLNRAMRGQADFGASSRSLKDYEEELLEKVEIAGDGIAVIVNKDNPLADISLKRLKSLYNGEVEDWKDLK